MTASYETALTTAVTEPWRAVAILLDVQQVGVDGSDRTLFQSLSLTLSDGDRVGVVGINGSGKSTLLRVLAGEQPPDRGTRKTARSLEVGFLTQEPTFDDVTVREVLGVGWESEATLDRLAMADQIDTKMSALSGGQIKRVALARTFAQRSGLIILDEPTNHLDLNAIEWLEQQIANFPGAIVLVSHDRFLLDTVTTKMVEIDRGDCYIHPGGYARLLEAQAEREEQAASAEATRRNLARRELAWLRRGVKARATKPQARIDAAERLLATTAKGAARSGQLEFMTNLPRLGTSALRAHNVTFAYPESEPTLADVTLDIGPGDRVGVVGPNGAGKSTLARVLAKELGAPQRNDQARLNGVAGLLRPTQRTGQRLSRAFKNSSPVRWASRARWTTRPSCAVSGLRAPCKSPALATSPAVNAVDCNCSWSWPQTPTSSILDEPTNDLDLETIRLLESFLASWPGTLIVVSHDRTFLSQTTDRLLGGARRRLRA
jgi:ATP-binding cassette subfamily F protein uup